MDINKSIQLIKDKIGNWFADLIAMLPNILLASIVLVIGIFFAKKLKKIAAKFITRISPNTILNNLFGSFVYLFLVGIVLFTVLSILQLDKAVTSILAGAGIFGLALAFAFQDIAANFISGIFISFHKPFKIDDIVKVSDYMGKIKKINLRDTVIQTFQGQMVIIPNKDIFQNPIENFSLLGKRRMDLVVGVSYGDDLVKVKNIALEAVKEIDNLSEGEGATLFYETFGDSSINFVIRIWVNSPEQQIYLQVCNDAVMNIKKAFDQNNITIPFPIRTLDFGVKGGTSLAEMGLNK